MAKNILVIDDDKMITKTLQKLLVKKGYGVLIVDNGKDALERIQSFDFDLLICDIRMPQMDGIETIEAIRKERQAQKKTPIREIIITGYADEEKYKSAVNLKVADYIYKPFDIQDLLAAVKKNLT